MNYKIQISVALVGVITVAIWIFGNNSDSSPDKISSTSSNPAPEVVDNRVVLQNQIYSIDDNAYPDGLVINDDAAKEILNETVATYTNSEGQQIEIIVTSGSKGAGIVPVN